MIEIQIPPELAAVANGRDYITTREFAKALNKQPQTVRKVYCQTGQAYGVKPTKIGNSLDWPVRNTAAVLTGRKK